MIKMWVYYIFNKNEKFSKGDLDIPIKKRIENTWDNKKGR